MTTGIEPIVTKTATSAAIRAAGWGVGSLRRRFSDKRTLEELDASLDLRELQVVLDGLTPSQLAGINGYVASPELDQLCLSLTTDYLVGSCGRKHKGHREQMLLQLKLSLEMAAGLSGGSLERVTQFLFRAIDQVVAIRVGVLMQDGKELAPPLRAALLQAAASNSAATSRNTGLLRHLADLGAVNDFALEFQGQVGNLHGAMRLPHAGTTRQVPYELLFVPPSVLRAGCQEPEDEDAPDDLDTLLRCCLRVVLLGNPGGGKSTLSLKLAYDIASGKSPATSASTPFLVVLRNYAEHIRHRNLSLHDYLIELCKLPYGIEPPEGSVEYVLLNGRAFVIFDGLDELLDVSLRRDVVQAVEAFAYRYPTVSILVTSREIGYAEAPLDDRLFVAASLKEFDDDQVKAYVYKWLV